MDKIILVVDDHEEIRDLLGEYLRKHGYEVLTADSAEQMRRVMQRQPVDLIILDVMMPGESGLDVLQWLRAQQGPPVILLTAMNEDADCVVGLELGADDYVIKPFVPRILLARIKAVLRRQPEELRATQTLASGHIGFEGWTLDVLQRQLIREDGLIIPLSQSEFALLKVFVERPQQVLNRDRLLILTKGREAQPFDRSIDNLISRLRKKIEQDVEHPRLIKTVWGGGYLFAAEVKQ